MNGIIEGYVGPEGSGKTLMMTFYADRCAKSRLKMFAFPGYELLNKKGKVVTEEITPLDFLRNFQTMTNVCLCITEITNFGIDAYQYNGLIPRIFGNASAMRRKLGLIILYDVQNFSMIPPRIRFFTHTLMFCKDSYFGHQYDENPIPRGTSIQTRRMDLKGFYTGREGWLGVTRYLNHADDLWNRYNTRSIVDPLKWGLAKYKREDLMPQDGQIDGETAEFIKSNMKNSVSGLENHRLKPEETNRLILEWANEVRGQGIFELPVSTVNERLEMLGLVVPATALGRILKQANVVYHQDRTGNYYRFE